jgi:hypothetical protein
MGKKYRVTLTSEEQAELNSLISKGKGDARKLAHARVLLQADETPGWPARIDDETTSALNLSVRTVERVGRRFVEQGLPPPWFRSQPNGFTPGSRTGSRRPT